MRASDMAVRPRIGLHYGATDYSMPVLDLAHAADQRGFESLVLPEHTHLPVARTSPYPTGQPMPERYKALLDPYIALAFVAAQTSLAVGTCISLIAQHDPIALAKAVATLDYLSGGRMSVGVGYGWNVEELADHGHAFADRYAVVRDHAEVMKALWADGEVGFEGRHASVQPSWANPKPIQRPGVPLLLGTPPTDRGLNQIVRWADGWLPVVRADDSAFTEGLAELRRRWAAAGRPEAGPRVAVLQFPLPGSELAARIDSYAALGVHDVYLDLPTEPSEVVLPMLDEYREALALA